MQDAILPGKAEPRDIPAGRLNPLQEELNALGRLQSPRENSAKTFCTKNTASGRPA